jgi:peptidoglycan/xylan/chitin deacetylase (PgdA/CDA1 family)
MWTAGVAWRGGDFEVAVVDQSGAEAIRGVTAGSIVLMHDAGGDRSQTVAALPRILGTLQERGFAFVPVDPANLRG